MIVGTLVGQQFEIVRLTGQGGMGAVYEALDQATGDKVALKVMNRANPEERERFHREAEVLAALSHPAIVKYKGHGELAGEGPYLVMEWLSGTGLDERIGRERLSVEETLTLAERIAGALSCAHTAGVVHRDIKPSNIFLPDGQVRRAMLLDFGIARRADESKAMTATGIFMGTAGYVPPEQARGDREISPRADVFALGCVLFECLVGKPAFTGQHIVAVLAKVLFEDVPRVSTLRPGVPAAVDALIAKMIAKHASERYADGEAVATAVGMVANGDVMSEPPLSLRSSRALGSGEQRLVCVLLISAANQKDAVVDPFGGTLGSAGALPIAALQATARAYGARVEPLADGSLALVLAGGGMPTDLATQAARCALALRAVVPLSPMVLVTGRGVFSGSLPVGEAIDRAALLLRQAEESRGNEAAETGRAGVPIALDELSAELLHGRFEITSRGTSRALFGEAAMGEGARPLLGRVTPCVGREREIATLVAFYEECANEEVARAVIITGAAGLGKSRIRQEFVQKLAALSQPPEIWIAHGDPTRVGAAFGMAGQLLRRAASLHEQDPLEVRHEKIRATIERHLGKPSPRIAEFYGELVGAPFPDDTSAVLRAARRDPVVMGGELRRAFEDFVGGVGGNRPVVIVLEDLHWADSSSVQLMDATLRLGREKPLLVLALGRPDVFDRFPGLWSDRGVQEIRLGDLPRRAAERLARYVLGEETSAALLARVVGRAAGNPFFLEELLRAVAEGREASLPDTVMAMLQARLESLSAESRWLLRAGSVFGETFWRGGVRALLGGETSVVDVDRCLQTLVQRELLVPRRESRYLGEDEFVFRHDLVREVAYEALTKDDRGLGHRLAAEWLEKAGERDAMVLAEHNERGGESERAALFFGRAATQSLAADDFEAVLERSERALACGAKGSLLGEVRQAQAEAHFYRGELPEAARHAREAMQHLSPESPLWFGAASAAAWAESSRGERRQLLGIAEAMLERVVHEGSPLSRRLSSMGWITRMLLRSGQRAAARTLMERFENAPEEARLEPLVSAEWLGVWATRALVEGDLESAFGLFLQSAQRFEEAGVGRFGLSMRVYAAMVLCDLGDHEAACAELKSLALRADASCLPMLAASARHGLAEALLEQGKPALAREKLEDILETLTDAGLLASAHDVRQLLALVLVELGDNEAAEAAAIEAVALVDAPPSRRCSYLATLARVLIANKRPAEALSNAEEAMVLLGEVGALLSDEPLVRLVYVEVLLANGEVERAKVALREAREHVLRRAGRIADIARRERFLRAVGDNAATLALAALWLGETG